MRWQFTRRHRPLDSWMIGFRLAALAVRAHLRRQAPLIYADMHLSRRRTRVMILGTSERTSRTSETHQSGRQSGCRCFFLRVVDKAAVVTCRRGSWYSTRRALFDPAVCHAGWMHLRDCAVGGAGPVFSGHTLEDSIAVLNCTIRTEHVIPIAQKAIHSRSTSASFDVE